MDILQKTAERNAAAACDDMMRAADNVAAELADLSPAMLADIGAQIKRAADAIAKADKACKARILDEAADGELRGASFTARVVESVRWTLDAKRVRSEMGDAWCDERSKQAHVRSVRYAV